MMRDFPLATIDYRTLGSGEFVCIGRATNGSVPAMMVTNLGDPDILQNLIKV